MNGNNYGARKAGGCDATTVFSDALVEYFYILLLTLPGKPFWGGLMTA